MPATPAQKAAMKRWQAKNRDKAREYQRRWRAKNPDKVNALMRQWIADNPDRWADLQRRAQLKIKFGITATEYETILSRQKGVCAVCSTPPNGRRLAVDHDHRTGIVRGLLCVRCNVMIGYAQDNPETLQAAINYLVFS